MRDFRFSRSLAEQVVAEVLDCLDAVVEKIPDDTLCCEAVRYLNWQYGMGSKPEFLIAADLERLNRLDD